MTAQTTTEIPLQTQTNDGPKKKEQKDGGTKVPQNLLPPAWRCRSFLALDNAEEFAKYGDDF